METPTQTDMNIRLLQKEHRQIDALSLEYLLWQICTDCSSYYAIEILANDESDMESLGQNYNRAQRIYEMLFNETVTPCTLPNILHDIRASEEECHYLQNLSSKL